jgi:Zn ribbon nucleic-acid-binding protein
MNQNLKLKCPSCGAVDDITVEWRINGYMCLGCGFKWKPQFVTQISADSIATSSVSKTVLTELSEEQIDSVCLSFRHAVGLLGAVDQDKLRTECKLWYDAIRKELE